MAPLTEVLRRAEVRNWREIWVPEEWSESAGWEELGKLAEGRGVGLVRDDRRGEEEEMERGERTEATMFDRGFWRLAEKVEREEKRRD